MYGGSTKTTIVLPRLVLNSVLVVAEEAHPQKHVPRIFTRVLQPPAYCTDHILQAVSPTPGDEVGDLSSDKPTLEINCTMITIKYSKVPSILYTSSQASRNTKRPLYTSSTASTMLQWGCPSRGQVLLRPKPHQQRLQGALQGPNRTHPNATCVADNEGQTWSSKASKHLRLLTKARGQETGRSMRQVGTDLIEVGILLGRGSWARHEHILHVGGASG